MHVSIDSDKCQGHGRCYSLAPAVFDSDDEGYAILLIDGSSPVPVEFATAPALLVRAESM